MHDGDLQNIIDSIEDCSQLADIITELCLACWEDSDQTAATRGAVVGAVAVAQHRVLTFIDEPNQ